jgi:Putative zinc-finger
VRRRSNPIGAANPLWKAGIHWLTRAAEVARIVSTELHCKECVELLGDYADGVLPVERAEALERHLSMCMPCITFLRTYKETSKAARRTLQQEMPAELTESLHSFLKGAIPGFTCKPGGCKEHPARKSEKS